MRVSRHDQKPQRPPRRLTAPWVGAAGIPRLRDAVIYNRSEVRPRESRELRLSLGVPVSAATPVGRFRIVAFWEGISFLLLLFVAMPLKYGLGMDAAVRIVGMAHGILFVGYCATLALAAKRLGPRLSALAFALSFVPGGTFWLEARLRRDEREREQRAA